MMTHITFGKPIYTNILDVDTDKVVSIIKKENEIKKSGSFDDVSDRLASTSSNKHVLEDKKLKFLKDLLLDEFYKFSYDVMKYSNKFRITTSWLTECNTGESSNYHNHNNCMYSGVFYLQAKENSGDIEFTRYSNDARWILETTEINDFNTTSWSWHPTPNLLLIFPSEVYHKIRKNNSDSTRYSIAFNLVPTGLIGSAASDSHYISK